MSIIQNDSKTPSFNLTKDIQPFLQSEDFEIKEIELISYLLENRSINQNCNFLKKGFYNSSIESLLQKNIIEKKQHENEVIYRLISIEHFFSWVRKNTKEKVSQMEQNTNIFIKNLRESLDDSVKSEVLFFEGIEGIKDSYRHILDNAKDEICAYFSVVEREQKELQNFFDQEYSPERARRKIFSRNITPKTPKTTYYSMVKDDLYMEIRMVQESLFPIINSEINLYEDYMHCMTFNEYGGFAIIVKGNMAILHKALFEIAWQTCGQLNSIDNLQQLGSKKDFAGEYLYQTDDVKFILNRINKRKNKFFPGMKEQWKKAFPIIEITEAGEHILKIFDLEVMSDFQKPYMKALAKNATMHGGKILNIGFGLGIVDTYIEELRSTREITEHHIVELNEHVFTMAEEWREKQPNKEQIFLHLGNWEVVLLDLQKKEYVFDGVVYDAYPLEIDEICRDSVSFLYSLIKFKLVKEYSGIITFYLDTIDGMSEKFQSYLQALGVNEIQVKKINVSLPDREREHWDTPYFLAPLLTDIQYPPVKEEKL